MEVGWKSLSVGGGLIDKSFSLFRLGANKKAEIGRESINRCINQRAREKSHVPLCFVLANLNVFRLSREMSSPKNFPVDIVRVMSYDDSKRSLIDEISITFHYALTQILKSFSCRSIMFY